MVFDEKTKKYQHFLKVFSDEIEKAYPKPIE